MSPSAWHFTFQWETNIQARYARWCEANVAGMKECNESGIATPGGTVAFVYRAQNATWEVYMEHAMKCRDVLKAGLGEKASGYAIPAKAFADVRAKLCAAGWTVTAMDEDGDTQVWEGA